jgi:hypothetical protein
MLYTDMGFGSSSFMEFYLGVMLIVFVPIPCAMRGDIVAVGSTLSLQTNMSTPENIERSNMYGCIRKAGD